MKVDWIRDDLRAVQEKIEHAINGTPTGEKRNLLTEANMYAMLALDKLKEAARTP
jgi:hypothetical protein